jgi:hypothetical protein
VLPELCHNQAAADFLRFLMSRAAEFIITSVLGLPVKRAVRVHQLVACF